MKGAYYCKSKTRVKNEMAFQKLGCCNILVPYSGRVTVSVPMAGGWGGECRKEVSSSTGLGKMERYESKV